MPLIEETLNSLFVCQSSQILLGFAACMFIMGTYIPDQRNTEDVRQELLQGECVCVCVCVCVIVCVCLMVWVWLFWGVFGYVYLSSIPPLLSPPPNTHIHTHTKNQSNKQQVCAVWI